MMIHVRPMTAFGFRLVAVPRLAALLLAALLGAVPAAPASAATTYYVAPTSQGFGHGGSPENAVNFESNALWNSVESSLQSGPVNVVFTDGMYTGTDSLVLADMGHEQHQLTIEGQNPGGAVFSGSHQYQLRLRGVRNATLRDLHFRGDPEDFALHIGMIGSVGSENITVEDSTFVDLNNTRYGAIGMTGRNTHTVTVRDNHFERGGIDGHYHHVYTSGASSVHDPGPYDLVFDNNHFEDSRGDYLRLRNQIGYTEVTNNTFLSTQSWGTAAGTNRPFLYMPAFNDFTDVGREYISTELLVDGNHFEFASNYSNWFNNGLAISFYAAGNDPPGVRYLLTPDEADMLENGTLEEQFYVLEEVIGLNLDTIEIGENTFINERMEISYHAWANYDHVEHNGWEGIIDITYPLTIPEPGTLGLAGLLGGLLLLRRR